jgi:hypothetical protein
MQCRRGLGTLLQPVCGVQQIKSPPHHPAISPPQVSAQELRAIREAGITGPESTRVVYVAVATAEDMVEHVGGESPGPGGALKPPAVYQLCMYTREGCALTPPAVYQLCMYTREGCAALGGVLWEVCVVGGGAYFMCGGVCVCVRVCVRGFQVQGSGRVWRPGPCPLWPPSRSTLPTTTSTPPITGAYSTSMSCPTRLCW